MVRIGFRRYIIMLYNPKVHVPPKKTYSKANVYTIWVHGPLNPKLLNPKGLIEPLQAPLQRNPIWVHGPLGEGRIPDLSTKCLEALVGSTGVQPALPRILHFLLEFRTSAYCSSDI